MAQSANEIKIFNKWSLEDISVDDMSLQVISLSIYVSVYLSMSMYEREKERGEG